MSDVSLAQFGNDIGAEGESTRRITGPCVGKSYMPGNPTYDQMISDLYDSKLIGMVGLRTMRLALDLEREHGLPITVGLLVARGVHDPVVESRARGHQVLRTLSHRGMVVKNQYNEWRISYDGIARQWRRAMGVAA